MTLYELLKVLSSESKAKIVLHFLNCGCTQSTVTNLCDGFELKQANFSKHLMDLKKMGIVECTKESKEIFYRIDKNFADQWGEKIKNIFCPSFAPGDLCSGSKCGIKEQ